MERTANVAFKRLEFQGGSYLDSQALNLRFVRVAIDTGDMAAKISIHKPLNTPHTDGKTLRTQGKEKNKTNEFTGEITTSMSPSGKLGGKRSEGSKTTSTYQTTESDARTTASHRLGVVWWGFAIRDPHIQTSCFFTDGQHPEVAFEFDSEDPIPSQMQVEVASYWFSSADTPSQVARASASWKSFFRNAKKTSKQALPYYNFCHAVKVHIPPNLTSKQERTEVIDFNTTSDEGNLTIQKGRTTSHKGEFQSLDHTVAPVKDEYYLLQKETEREPFISICNQAHSHHGVIT